MLVDRKILKYVCDERAVRGLSSGLSDHTIVLWKVILEDGWRKKEY